MKPPLSKSPFSIGVPALIWQSLFFYLPLIILFASSFLSFSETRSVEFSLSKILFFLKPTYFRVIGASFFLALTTALLCVCIGYPLAYFLAFSSKRLRTIFLFLLVVPFWTNFLLHVYAWFFVLEREGFLNQILRTLHLTNQPLHILGTHAATLIMMVYYYLPFMVLPLYSSLEKFDVRLIEASFDLGASWLQTFRRVLLPLTRRGIIGGFFLVYIPAFGEFAIPELMGGDKQMFVGTAIAHYILGDATGPLGAAFTLIAACCLLLSSGALYFLLFRYLFRRIT